MTSVAEARVIEAAQNIASNVVSIRKLSKEIREAKCAKPTEVESGYGGCVFQKVQVGATGYEESAPTEILPWYEFDPARRKASGEKSSTAAEIGSEFGYCPECVLQVDRFRERKALKAKKGGLVSALVRVVAIMERKASVKA